MNALQLFLKLVTIPSPTYQVGKIQSFLTDLFLATFPEAGIYNDSAGQDMIPGFEAGNLLINIPASPGKQDYPILAIEAHVDTVPENNPTIPLVTAGIVYSDGTTILGADDKAAVAAIWEAMQIVNVSPHGPIQIIFSVGEESSMYGMRAFDFSKIKADTILCVDGFSPCEVITACAGKIKYRATFTGQSAHGAEPEKAINAITMAAAAIATCDMHHLTGRLNNGMINNIAEIQSHSGESQYPHNNTIPGSCIVSGEIRGFSKEELKEAADKIKDIFRRTAEGRQGEVDFEWLIPYQPFDLMTSQGVESKIFDRLRAKNPGTILTTTNSYGSTHANIYNERGIESVVIGAGCRNPHTHKELLIISELEEAVNIIANYLRI
jgi:tripeptide aminopeptidase